MTKRSRRADAVQIDWNTVEMIGPHMRLSLASPRGRARQLLSGASMRARARGAIFAHARLRRTLRGIELFIYEWRLVAAAMEDDLSRGVEIAARAIDEASRACAATSST